MELRAGVKRRTHSNEEEEEAAGEAVSPQKGSPSKSQAPDQPEKSPPMDAALQPQAEDEARRVAADLSDDLQKVDWTAVAAGAVSSHLPFAPRSRRSLFCDEEVVIIHVVYDYMKSVLHGTC